MRAVFIAALAMLAILSCRQAPHGSGESGYGARTNTSENSDCIDSALRLLRDGDIALRTGIDMTSIMLRGMNQRDSRFSHCGIVLLENGYPFVYHSIGGEDNPDARLRRDSACNFFAPAEAERLGIARLDLSPSQLGSLAAIARRYFKAGIPFDMEFDLGSDDRFYCAEFVCKSVQEAVGNPRFFTRSTALKREYFGVDDVTGAPRARLICDLKYSR